VADLSKIPISGAGEFRVGASIILLYFIEIAATVAEKSQFLIFYNGSHLPSWTCCMPAWDHLQLVVFIIVQ